MGQKVVLQCLPLAGVNGVTTTGSNSAWRNIGNVLAKDGRYANTTPTAALSNTLNLLSLKPTAPGWESYIQAGATLTGLFITIWRLAENGNTIVDSSVIRLDGGAPIGTDLANTSTPWGVNYPVFEAASYGGGTDRWGSLPTLAEVANGALGVRLVANATAGSMLAEVEFIDVRVEVTQPDPPSKPPAGGAPSVTVGADVAAIAPALLQRRGLFADKVASLEALYQKPIRLVWLAAFEPYSEDLAATQYVYLSNTAMIEGFRSGANDPVSSAFFEPRLIQPFQFTESLFGVDRLVGGAGPSTGQTTVDNGDHDLDDWSSWIWSGRRARIWLGIDIPGLPRDRMPMRDFDLVFDGYSDELSGSETLTVALIDRSRLLGAPCLPVRYAGTGGTEGGADQADTPKPAAFGTCANIPLRGVDSTNFIVQAVGNFPFKALTNLYKDGVVSASGFTTDLVRGTIDFTSDPAATVTADIEGWRAQNQCKDSRDGTQASWTKTNCTAAACSGVSSGSGTQVTATSANATIAPQWNGTLNTLANTICYSVYARLVSGDGLVKLFGQSSTVTLTSDWRRYYMVQSSTTSPALADNGRNILVVTSGSVIQYDHYQIEPGALRPSPPIVTATSVVYNYPETAGAIIYFAATALAGLVPHVGDFDEEAFAAIELKESAPLGIFISDDMTVQELISRVCDSASLYCRVNGEGALTIDRWGVTDQAPQIRLTDTELSKDQPARRARSFPRAAKARIKYLRNYTVQNSVSSSVAVARRDAIARQWREIVIVDDALLAKLASAAGTDIVLAPNDLEYETLHTDSDEATAFGRFVLDQNGQDRQMIELMDVSLTGLDLVSGQSVRLSIPSLTHTWKEQQASEIGYVDHIVVRRTIDAQRQTIGLVTWGNK